jgi:hypothetical protein
MNKQEMNKETCSQYKLIAEDDYCLGVRVNCEGLKDKCLFPELYSPTLSRGMKNSEARKRKE